VKSFLLLLQGALGVLVLVTLATTAWAQTAPAITAISSPRQVVTLGQSLTLSVTATGTPAPTYQWKRNGLPIPGATAASYTITSAVTWRDYGWYQAVATNSSGLATSAVVFVNVAVNFAQVLAWGDNSYGQTTVPAGLNNVVGLAAGNGHVVALKSDGTVAAWGNNTSGQATVPNGLSDVVSVAAGNFHTIALKSDGTVVAWCYNNYGQTTVPVGLTNVVSVTAGDACTIALKSDGSVVAWGFNGYGQTTVPSGLSNVVGVAAGFADVNAIRSDGKVVAWGFSSSGATAVPASLGNVVGVAAGGDFTVAMKADGTLVAWGNNSYGQMTIPASLGSVVGVTAGANHVVAMKADGSVMAWGGNYSGQITVPVGLSRDVGLSAGANFSVVLRDISGVAPTITMQPSDQTTPWGQTANFTIAATGTPAPTYRWQVFRPGDSVWSDSNFTGATSATLSIPSVSFAVLNWKFRCVVSTGVVPDAISSEVKVNIVTVPPTITTQPANQTVALGQTATFTVAASSSDTPSYSWSALSPTAGSQWGSLSNPNPGPDFSGGATPILTVKTSSANYQGWQFRCQIQGGGTSVFSNSATLTVNNAPAITTQPQSQTITMGGTATFSVAAAGLAPLSYQWQKNGADLNGATAVSYTISYAQPGDAGAYKVVVTNSAGNAISSAATLTINTLPGTPTITSVNTATFIAGQAGSFTVTATGAPQPTFGVSGLLPAWARFDTTTGVLSGTPPDTSGSPFWFTFLAANTVWTTPQFFTLYVQPSNAVPVVTTSPRDQTVGVGQNAIFSVTASGNPMPTYQWKKDGSAIPGANGATYTVASVQTSDAGSYTVVVSNSAGSVTSAAGILTVYSSHLASLSVRAPAGIGDQSLILGFYIGGSGSKQVLIRGIGPTLAQYGVGGVLADPQLKLFNTANTQINQNDDWGGSTSLSNAFDSVRAFTLPTNSKDAALFVPLPSGGYSAQVNGANNSTGVALIEAYEADTGTPSARFVSLSARNQVGTGDNILIVGFVVAGNTPKQLLIRGVGPTLTTYGVSGVLADPKLELYSVTTVTTKIYENDNWGGTTDLNAAFTATQAFPLPASSKDAALLVTLQPGTYTAQVSGVGQTTGVALIEVYEMP
jgi:hypothetical protein